MYVKKDFRFFVCSYSEWVFFLFFCYNQTHRATKAQSTRPKTGTLNARILVLLSVKYVFKISGSSVALYSQRHKVI